MVYSYTAFIERIYDTAPFNKLHFYHSTIDKKKCGHFDTGLKTTSDLGNDETEKYNMRTQLI